jgi:hypothetical protein
MKKRSPNKIKMDPAETTESIEAQSRLDIYIIDSGWDSLPHRVLHRSLDLFKTYLTDHNVYILTPEQSAAFLKQHPDLIGKDPIIAIVDGLARKLNNPSGFGTRLELGLVHDAYRLEYLLKMFLQIVNTKTDILDITETFREHNHKEGVRGAIEIIMESFGSHKNG